MFWDTSLGFFGPTSIVARSWSCQGFKPRGSRPFKINRNTSQNFPNPEVLRRLVSLSPRRRQSLLKFVQETNRLSNVDRQPSGFSCALQVEKLDFFRDL